MNIENAPILTALKDIDTFKFYYRNILPAVFNDEMSYYECLAKTLEYLNEVIENGKIVGENLEKFKTAYTELLDYVNNYFDNLNVDDRVAKKMHDLQNDPNSNFNRIVRQTVLENSFPVVVQWVSQMTDKTKIYICTSQQNHIYYYDKFNNEWTDSGNVYGFADTYTPAQIDEKTARLEQFIKNVENVIGMSNGRALKYVEYSAASSSAKLANWEQIFDYEKDDLDNDTDYFAVEDNTTYFFPTAHYTFNRDGGKALKIRNKKNVHFIFHSNAKIDFYSSAMTSWTSFIRMDGCVNCSVEGLGQGSIHGLTTSAVDRDRNYLNCQNRLKYGIQLLNSKSITIKDCSFCNVGGSWVTDWASGIIAQGDCNNLVVDRCSVAMVYSTYPYTIDENGVVEFQQYSGGFSTGIGLTATSDGKYTKNAIIKNCYVSGCRAVAGNIPNTSTAYKAEGDGIYIIQRPHSTNGTYVDTDMQCDILIDNSEVNNCSMRGLKASARGVKVNNCYFHLSSPSSYAATIPYVDFQFSSGSALTNSRVETEYSGCVSVNYDRGIFRCENSILVGGAHHRGNFSGSGVVFNRRIDETEPEVYDKYSKQSIIMNNVEIDNVGIPIRFNVETPDNYDYATINLDGIKIGHFTGLPLSLNGVIGVSSSTKPKNITAAQWNKGYLYQQNYSVFNLTPNRIKNAENISIKNISFEYGDNWAEIMQANTDYYKTVFEINDSTAIKKFALGIIEDINSNYTDFIYLGTAENFVNPTATLYINCCGWLDKYSDFNFNTRYKELQGIKK